MRAEDLYRSPNALAPCYSRFGVASRLLLTGHSHQAWPDRSLDGQLRAWTDAAEAVDAKWERAFAMAERVRRGFTRMLGDDRGDYALGASTHELVVRLLSALPLGRRPRLVTTDGEFHTLRRQLDRLAEEGIEVVKVPAKPVSGIAERLARAADERTAAVLVSAVLFGSGAVVPGLDRVMAACERAGAELLVDVYHAANVVPYPLRELGLERAYAVGGGYKYCQMGEGNCFLRVPEGADLRPVVTGWYAEFDHLAAPPGGGVGYSRGAASWAGATYDPTSHYRAAAVLDFFADQGLGVDLLRAVSQHQVGLLAERFDALDLPATLVARDRALPLAETGGFLALTSPVAADLSRRLAERGVATDHRGDVLRLGPAPYLADDQLREAMAILGEVARRQAIASP
jgi:kynureninase